MFLKWEKNHFKKEKPLENLLKNLIVKLFNFFLFKKVTFPQSNLLKPKQSKAGLIFGSAKNLNE